MANIRLQKINEEVRREIEYILRHNLRDPGLSTLVSVVRTEVTRDLAYAKVYVSVLGSESERAEAMQALDRAGGFVRRELAGRIELRRVPSLVFVSDNSIEYAVNMAQKIAQVIQQDESK
jgi:ribosome-binding factor A